VNSVRVNATATDCLPGLTGTNMKAVGSLEKDMAKVDSNKKVAKCLMEVGVKTILMENARGVYPTEPSTKVNGNMA
jgi:hypothetical protein